MRRARWAVLAGAVALIAAACGDGGSTEVGSPPTALVPISTPVDTVVTGEITDPPIAVRVEDALGNPVEGTPVRFIIVRGEGELSPGVAVAGQDGIAESVYRAGPTPGEAEIQADIPSASSVLPLRFLVLAATADTVTLSVVEGDVQRAEASSQLPLPFTIRAETASGAPAGGVRIAFRSSAPADDAEVPTAVGDTAADVEGVPAGAPDAPADDPGLPVDDPGVLTHEVVVTDADGLGHAVFTLGRRPGDYRVDVFATGGVYSDTLSLTATALTAPDGLVQLDSVGSGRLAAGTRAMLFGRGFSTVPADNEVRIEGVRAAVVSSTGTELMIEVPMFGGSCLPQREVGVRVLVGGDASNGPLLPLDPAERLVDLEVGQALTLRGPVEVECVHFAPGETERAFNLIVANTGRVASRPLPIRMTTRTSADMSGDSPDAAVTPAEIDPGLEEVALADWRADIGIRSRTLDGLVESGIAPFRPAEPAAAMEVPAVGDTLDYFFPVRSNLVATCADLTRPIRGEVRALGERVLLLEDVSAPPGGPTGDEWVALADRLDQTVLPVATSYFGPYEDIDRNGRVIVFFTPEVNKLGDGEAGVAGFFLPLDLAASGRGGEGVPDPNGEPCPASNEAEIIYSVSADPEGGLGRTIAADRLLRDTPALVAHEVQHLISAARRALHSPTGFAATEEVWLDEALSGLAEEVTGLAALGLTVGDNLTFDQVSETPDALEVFDTYLRGNFLNLGLYMLGTMRAPTISTDDPDGVGGMQMRGFGWFLLRWLADQEGGDERAFFRSVVGGGQSFARGIANLERVTGIEWADILADASVALAMDDAAATDDAGAAGAADDVGAVDDAGQTGSARRFAVATWNVRDVFASMNRDAEARLNFPTAFPLRAEPLGFETRVRAIDVGPSNVQYFSLASDVGAPALSLSIRTAAGTSPDETAEPQITIVRTK
ncbi:hypothetical protein [Candidatus Palauibacter sp.]|uniref:hypothetical protein n=1 Tax=Candidatus Palauibacter sp. TaxID=3101350 RepID=UPI003AF1EF90